MGAELDATEQFGPYLVYERLGVGGMATVHRALERGIEGFERVVALKRLLPHLAEDASFIKSFVREAKLASVLNHVNIVQIYELGRVGTEYFISMEYIDGRDIRRILRHARKVTGPPPIHVTIGLLLQLCEALDYAHTKVDEHGTPLQLVHRDVSPSNVLVTSAGHVKVIDFGIAKAQSSQLRTQTGRIKGKLAYMAPEAISGKELDARSDLFAVGVIAHELLTARPLFASKNEYQTLLKVQRGDIMPPSTFNQACPPELDAIVLKALSREPDERYASALELRDALLSVARARNLATSYRDIATWIDWAFSLEVPSGGFVGHTLEGSNNSVVPVDSQVLHATPGPEPIPLPSAAERPAREEEEAVELAWGGGEDPGEAGPVLLDDVPDVSDKHALPVDASVPVRRSEPSLSGRAASAASSSPALDPVAGASTTAATGAATGAAIDAATSSVTGPTIGRAYIDRRSGGPSKTAIIIAAIFAAGAIAIAVTLFMTRGETVTATPEPTQPRVRETTSGTVKFVLEPPDAEIWIESQLVHSGSPWSTELEAGVHQIQIMRNGYKAWLTSIELSPAETQTLRVVLEPLGSEPAAAAATLRLSSDPPGLDVVIDGVALGAKTPIKVPLDVGPHTIVLRQNGTEVWRQDLVARASADYEFNPSMSEDKLRERAQRRRRAAARTDGEPAARATTSPSTTTAQAQEPATAATTATTTTPATTSARTQPDPAAARATTPATTATTTSPTTTTSTTNSTSTSSTPPKPTTPAITTPAPSTTTTTPSVPKATGPVTIPPNAVKKVAGDPPEILQHRGAEVPSVVAAKLCINHLGQVTDATLITKLDPRVASDVLGGLRRWRYEPYKMNGVPVAACFAVSFRAK